MRPLERSPKPSVQPTPARRAAGISDSVVVLSGTGVLMSTRVTRHGTSGLNFVVIEGGVIHAASH